MTKRQKTRFGAGGCGYLIWSCLVSCLLLVFNGAVVLTALRASATGLLPENSRIPQLILLAAPVAMLFPEWWLLDFCVDWFSSRRGDRRRQRRK